MCPTGDVACGRVSHARSCRTLGDTNVGDPRPCRHRRREGCGGVRSICAEDPEEIRSLAEIGLQRLLHPEEVAAEAVKQEAEQERARQERLDRQSEADARITDKRCAACGKRSRAIVAPASIAVWPPYNGRPLGSFAGCAAAHGFFGSCGSPSGSVVGRDSSRRFVDQQNGVMNHALRCILLMPHISPFRPLTLPSPQFTR